MAILPSSLLKLRNPSDVDFTQAFFGNNSLRLGIVIGVHNPEDETNQSGFLVEYDVMTVEQDKHNGVNTAIYNNCINAESFGSVADFFEAKLRKTENPKEVREKGSFEDEKASLVLLLCLDSNSEKGVILGSIQNPERKSRLGEGLHAEGEYNGVNWQINDDGELKVTFRGKTDKDGNVVEEAQEAGGSFVKFSKDGSFRVETEEGNSIELNKPDESLNVKTGESVNITTKSTSLTSEDSVNVSTNDLVMSAQGSAALNAGSIKLESGGEFEGKAKSGNLDFGSQLTLKTSSFKVKAQEIELGQGATPAVTAQTTTIGTGVYGVPVISSMVGPFSASVKIGS